MQWAGINSCAGAAKKAEPETTSICFEVFALISQRVSVTKQLYALFSEGKIISGEEKTQSAIKQKNVFVSYCFSYAPISNGSVLMNPVISVVKETVANPVLIQGEPLDSWKLFSE